MIGLQRYQTNASIAFSCVATWLFGIVTATATEDLTIHSRVFIWIAIGFFVTIGLSLLLRRRSPDIDTIVESPLTLRHDAEKQMHAKEGFVGFVSIYTPERDSPAAKLTQEERETAIKEQNFQLLQLEKSNLKLTIEAVRTHASQLKHCWLLSTYGQQTQGSLPYAELVVAYLKTKEMKCEFYYGQEYAISLDNDALVLGAVYKLLKKVLQEARNLHIAPHSIVADMTSGFRSMTLGMVLAFLARERDIQFMGTAYDELGKPYGELTPIVFSFEPQLISGSR
jgi:hypothetical protein